MRWRIYSCSVRRVTRRKPKGKKETKTEWRHLWKYYIPPRLTMSKQTADSGMSWTAMMGSFCRFLGWGLLWISCRDALRLSLLHSRCKITSVQMKSFHCPPPLCVVNHLCVSVSPWALIAMPGCLRSPWLSLSLQPLSLSRKQPPFFHFFLFNASGDPPLTFEAVSADPATTSPKPLSLVCLLLHAPLPLLLLSVFSLQSALNTKAHADMQEALRTLSCRCSRGFNLHQWCPTILGAPTGNADTHLSTQQI